VDQHHEGGGTAVEDRDLRPVYLDLRIVDPKTGKGAEEVLDGADGDAVAAERRTGPA